MDPHRLVSSRTLHPIGAALLVLLVSLTLPLHAAGPSELGPAAQSLAFFENQPADYDYGLQLDLPSTFGEAEFTLELWIWPDETYPVGSTSGGPDQLVNWSDSDEEPYSSCCWWYAGNFLLDGHNNNVFADGTFSLQFYGGGRVRWLFGDGASTQLGGVWSVGAFPASTTPSLLDGQWHRVALVRRWSGATDAALELWIDGALVATETSPVRTDMRFWWDAWSGFPLDQEGWFWGAEKQAAIGALSQYEDYKGPMDAIRFYDRALSATELMDGGCLVEVGLVADFGIDEGLGTMTCDALEPTRCIDLIDMKPGFWASDGAPGCVVLFGDGFESGDISGWDGAMGFVGTFPNLTF